MFDLPMIVLCLLPILFSPKALFYKYKELLDYWLISNIEKRIAGIGNFKNFYLFVKYDHNIIFGSFGSGN